MGPLGPLDVEELLDRYEQPTHRGTLASPPALTATARNPRCGDVVTIFASVSANYVEQVRFEGFGCTLSQAAADVLAELAEGRPLDTLQLDALFDRLGRANVGSRVDCAGLAFETLQRALHDVQ